MASSLYNLALDFSKELNYTKAIMARQGDKGITVTVKPFLNGLQMDTSGGTFTLKGTTPSNRYVDSVATSITSEEVTFSLDGTFMSEAGYYKHCYVEYRKDDQILTTQDIIFFSLGVSDILQGQADEYVSQLEDLIRKYNETFDAFMAGIKGRVDSLNQQITDLTGQAKTLQEKLDALKEEISKLGNLQVMYSNSIEFGNYDYSGNPNLMIPLKASNFYTQSGVTVEDAGNALKVTFTKTDGTAFLESMKNIPALLPNTQYTLSADVTVMEGYTGKLDNLRLGYRKSPGGTIILPLTAKDASVGQKTRIYTTANSSAATDPSKFDKMYFTINTTPTEPFVGTVLIENIKVEQGTNATPYQPNLLDDPYWLGKAPLGENIANKSVAFPIKTSAYEIYKGTMTEPFVVGETYTVTLKGTKPADKNFRLFNPGIGGYGNLSPVEGLTDVWSLTVTVDKVAADPRIAAINQTPADHPGACQIDWLKIEKGDTRTPNIEQYKYRGIGMRDSNNPKDYVWDLEPEYVEDNLATDVKISEITGKANDYTDGKVSEINSQLTEMQKPVKYEAWFSGGTELRPANANSRFRVSEERLTIGTKLNVAMNKSPLEWNADRWEATFTRECSILVDVQTIVEFADQWGTYVYINMWKDTNQTQTWDTGYGMGTAPGTNFWFRTELSVSMYCMNAKVGDKFSIGLGMVSGKSLTSARIQKLHIMEL
ncbi:MAG: hypothetical protein ACLUA5_09880 [Enterococcus faecium]